MLLCQSRIVDESRLTASRRRCFFETFNAVGISKHRRPRLAVKRLSSVVEKETCRVSEGLEFYVSAEIRLLLTLWVTFCN